jgi:hypothetical protein
MNTLLIWFWAVLIFASIFWGGFLVFYVGIKAGREIAGMTRRLEARQQTERKHP